MIRDLRDCIDRLSLNILAGILFSKTPAIRCESERTECLCGRNLKVLKSKARTIATLGIGELYVHEKLKWCDTCSRVYSSQDLRSLVALGCKFGYDVLVHVDKSLFLRYRSEEEVQKELEGRNIRICRSEIAYLAKKFIVCLALAHREGSTKIKEAINGHGGYILHVDGMCDGDSPHLMSGLDEISNIVLGNIKVPTEKAEKLIPFFEKIKRTFGNPLATVHDMGKGISSAIRAVLPGILDFICHFHFLRDIGKDLFGKENDTIRKRLREHGIQGELRKVARTFCRSYYC